MRKTEWDFFSPALFSRLSPGSSRALQAAKSNIASSYAVVGSMERLGDFVRVAEAVLPGFFSGLGDGGAQRAEKLFVNVGPNTVQKLEKMKFSSGMRESLVCRSNSSRRPARCSAPSLGQSTNSTPLFCRDSRGRRGSCWDFNEKNYAFEGLRSSLKKPWQERYLPCAFLI